jgi:hypothetical protein
MPALRQRRLGVRESFRPGLGRCEGLWLRGAGMPCPSCDVGSEDNPPRLPEGFPTRRESGRRMSRYQSTHAAQRAFGARCAANLGDGACQSDAAAMCCL